MTEPSRGEAGDGRARVLALVGAARRVADPADPLGREARRVLPHGTGLSPEGVELALGTCLETAPSDTELDALVSGVRPAPAAHVLLSAGVFTGALRAIALALAASTRVSVRASRRDPLMVDLLHRAAPDLFRRVSQLEPASGEHVWAYGTDQTMLAVAASLPAGAVLHAHGSGIGVMVVDPAHTDETGDVADSARALASDVIPFDQRGCLSPRLVFVVGDERATLDFGARLASALEDAERRVPRGRLTTDEEAAGVRYRDVARFAGEVLRGGAGWVGVQTDGAALVVPPVGRHVHVVRVSEQGLDRITRQIAASVSTVATFGPPDLRGRVAAAFPGARASRPGHMQRPPLDGPVDRRVWRGVD